MDGGLSVVIAEQAADALAADGGGPDGSARAGCSLSLLEPKSTAVVVSVGSRAAPLTALERRLLELGFVHGEQLEVLAAAPGGDPFVVRVGSTTLALRRREVQAVWVEPQARHDRDER